jgi:flagellar basal-body rod modification protein FlgD
MVNGVSNNLAVPSGAESQNLGSASAGGLLSMEKDAAEAQTAPKFGDVWKQIQTKYGAKPEKPREIKKSLGKDDFLRIMMTQMRHQDPTKPFDAEQMASQMAQFASVEQLQNLNTSMQKMTSNNQPVERLAMTHMIGKTVTVDRGKFPHTEGQAQALSFTLPQDAASVKVAIVNEAGEKVMEKDLGPMKKGDQTFPWDGNKVNTLPAKAGTYTFDVEAIDARGTAMQLNPQRKAMVVGVSFEGAEPVLLVGDAKQQDRISMRNVIRIDNGGSAPMAASGMAVPGAAIAPAGAGGDASASTSGDAAVAKPAIPNLISFEKGVGSSNFDSSRMTPEVQQALAKYQTQAAPAGAQGGAPNAAQGAAVNSQTAAEKPTGFPNGLSELNNDEMQRGGEE